MAIKDYFNYRRRKEQPAPTTAQDRKLTAGGQITGPQSTIILTQPKRFDLDLSQYKQAVRAAENMDYERRVKLYDMYDDAMLDTHMVSVYEKRRNALLGAPVEFWRDGAPDENINVQLKSPWFHQFIGDIIDAKFWGFTLVQFTTGKDGYVEYFNVPRKHVDPQLRIIRRHQTDIGGCPFDEYPGLLFIQGPRRLGLLASCLPWIIRKNGATGDWAQFSELFGMPIRDYSYDANDELARLHTLMDAQEQGGAAVYVHPEGTKLSFIEAGNKTGSAEVYDKLVQTCNAEISKAILGNTLTTEASDTGTQALGTVHKKEEDGITRSDRQFILDVLNYEMTDIFNMLGINTDGGEFIFVETAEKSAAEKANLFNIARNQLGLPIDDDYIYQELGIEKPANYEALKAEQEARRKEMSAASAYSTPEEDTSSDGQKRDGGRGEGGPSNRARFFDDARDYGALNW